MNIVHATEAYEKWLASFTPLIEHDIALKHQIMAKNPFELLRATFYRWSQVWPKVCGEAAEAPSVLAVGDLHVENFGSWRDSEGRLIWGVNDFDEACHLPYTNDLIRLAASAVLAIEADHLKLTVQDACDTILSGYHDSIHAGGKAFVLAEENPLLRTMATGSLPDPVIFWKKMQNLPLVKKAIPESARAAIEHVLPEINLPYDVRHRIAGLGNLGRPRYVALANWKGGMIAREAKALVPPGSEFLSSSPQDSEIYYQAAIDRAVRCKDPFVTLQGQWILRRLAPDCSRIELTSLANERDEAHLLTSMGWETANIHLGSDTVIQEVIKDLSSRKKSWLRKSAALMAESVRNDWTVWRNHLS